MSALSAVMIAAGAGLSAGTSNMNLSLPKWLFEADGNDKLHSGNTLSQKARRRRQRQYRSQSFKKGGVA